MFSHIFLTSFVCIISIILAGHFAALVLLGLLCVVVVVVVVVQSHPRAILLAMITMRKAVDGFL